MTVNSSYDALDVGIVQALALDGRASAKSLAEALGVSSQTIGRRYARLREPGGLRVVGRIDPAPEPVRWMVRLRATPDAALSIAKAIARRDDTTHVSLVAGGTEVVCVTESLEATPETPLLQKLPAAPRVLDVQAQQLLHRIYGGRKSWYSKLAVLTDEQVARLQPPAPLPEAAVTAITDTLDAQLLALLREDARTNASTLGAALAMTEATVRRRIQRLCGHGVLYFDVQIDPATLGYRHNALLWLTCSPAHLTSVAQALCTHREVAFAAVTTGRSNIVVALICQRAEDIYRYITHNLAALTGVLHVETSPVLRPIKLITTLRKGLSEQRWV